jgi:UDP-glucose 6-dehydrogenase
MLELAKRNRQVALSITKHLDPNRFTVIVIKSTVPVGTAEMLSSFIDGLPASLPVLREGFAP